MITLTEAQYSAIRGAAAIDAAGTDAGDLLERAIDTIADVLSCVRADAGDGMPPDGGYVLVRCALDRYNELHEDVVEPPVVLSPFWSMRALP